MDRAWGVTVHGSQRGGHNSATRHTHIVIVTYMKNVEGCSPGEGFYFSMTSKQSWKFHQFLGTWNWEIIL